MATLAVTVVGRPGLHRTLASPLLENLSWGLLPSSPDFWSVDHCPCPGLSEPALPGVDCHMHTGKEPKVSMTVSECGPSSDPEARA